MFHSLFLVPVLSSFASVVTHATLVTADANSVFTNAEWSPETTLSYPGTAAFVNATERWSIFDQPTYGLAISPATEADVAQAVKLATSSKFPFLATGGRHGYTITLGNLQDGLAIDLSQLDTVEVDSQAGTLTIGGGVRLSDIYDAVFAAGYEIQIGTSSCPGMVGLTIGAGIGYWAGVHGLILDALISLRVVTANGTVIEVSEDCNPDLFWAFRGAGANFGIVVSATYQLQEQTNNGEIFVATFIVPEESVSIYLDMLGTYNNGTLPKELTISTNMGYNSSTLKTQIVSSWIYLGPEEDGRAAMKQMLELNPIVVEEAMYTWNNIIQTKGGGGDAYACLDGRIVDFYTINARQISPPTYKEAYDKLSKYFAETQSTESSFFQMTLYPNQAAMEIPDDHTAYPWRDTIAILDLAFVWENISDTAIRAKSDQMAHELSRDLAATSGYPGLATYVNSAHGDEPLEAIYRADKLPRLKALKAAWDPDNVFGFNNPLSL